MLAKLSEHSEFFVSAEKGRRLAIGCRICGNEQSYENKKKKHNNMKKYLLIKIYNTKFYLKDRIFLIIKVFDPLMNKHENLNLL